MREKDKEFVQVRVKREIYHVDVEPDQLLTGVRLMFANIPAFLAKEILDDTPTEMNTLIQSTLFLSGKIEQVSSCRKVCLNRNEKDTEFMAKLEKGLAKLNKLNIRHIGGQINKFELI